RNHARWRSRHPAVALDATPANSSQEFGNTLPSPADTPAETAERQDLAATVRNAVQDLPHDLRTTLLLFEFHDQGYQEIATALGCSTKAVETRLYRARKILSEKLARLKADG